MDSIAWLIFIAAALLEVCGDAVMRRGLRGRSIAFVMAGFLVLGCYGLVVNSVKWDFSKLIGVYVAFFAVISVLVGRLIFKETISTSAWIGLLLIVVGGMVIQFAHR
jgi:multidrug transporter EmrE-like cation transporter